MFVCAFPLKMINSGNVRLCCVIYPLRVPFVMSLDESIAVYTVKNKQKKKKNDVLLSTAAILKVNPLKDLFPKHP